jgi:polyribonucleotide nucleotidyltransferase
MSTIITHRQFPNYKKYEMDLAGRPLTLEVGKLAELANAAVMVGYGDTRVLVCATASPRPRDGVDFFPLSVDFEEKLYSVGRIPGSFNRREGRPGERGILCSRHDRPAHPSPVPLRFAQRRVHYVHRHERGPRLRSRDRGP